MTSQKSYKKYVCIYLAQVLKTVKIGESNLSKHATGKS